MIKKIQSISLAGLTASFFWLACGRNATEPKTEKASFELNVHYGKTVSLTTLPGTLSKAADVQSIDAARIMVLDLSSYDSWFEFINTEKGKEFHEAKHGWFQQTKTWAAWQNFYGGYLTIVSDQILEIKDGYATGMVTGVIGLNRLVLAFLDGNSIRYSGEADAWGEAGKTDTVGIWVELWGTQSPTANSIQVNSNPAGAAIYLDGTNMNRTTPAILDNTNTGHHSIRLYLAGYNEYNIDFDLIAGTPFTINAILQVPMHPHPVFTITEPANGDSFIDNVIQVRGSIELEDAVGDRSLFIGNKAILILNGVEKEVTVTNGVFNETISIASGENRIQLRANSENGNTGLSDEIVVRGDFVAPDIEITLTWNTQTSDLDLHVINPINEEAYFSHMIISDGSLDFDRTSEGGPETFTSNNATNGSYVVRVNCYSLHSDTSADATIQIRLNGGQIQTYGPYHFRVDDYNGSNPDAWWNVTTINYNEGFGKSTTSEIPERIKNKIESDRKMKPENLIHKK